MAKKTRKLYICSDGTRFYDGDMCGQHIFCNPGVICLKVIDI